MTETKTLTLDQLNFWSLPTEAQDKIKEAIPKLQLWELDAYRDEYGYWFFDLPQYGVHAEAFVNGTQKAIDWHYTYKCGLIPTDTARMKMTVSSSKHSPTDVPIFLEREDPVVKDSHYYSDSVSGRDIWLCPFVQILFGDVPETLYIQFEPYA